MLWSETPAERDARIRQQMEDRASFINDGMELLYSDDVDELFAELLRLHGIVKDERTQELIDRLFGDQGLYPRT
jgi:hypothetical protein